MSCLHGVLTRIQPTELVSRGYGLALVLALCLSAISAVLAADSPPQITDLQPLVFQRGINTIERFAPDGRPALVTMGWRDNGNAHGFHVFLVMLPTATGQQDWNVVGIAPGRPGGPLREIVRDTPHTGEDMVRSVRFARGKVDGAPAMLMLTATRELAKSGALPDPSPVGFEIFRLERSDEIGETRDVFRTVSSWRSARRYCHADAALREEVGLALPAGYEGPPTKDGCARGR